MIIFGWKMGITRDEFRVIKLGPLDSHVPVAKLTSGPRIFFMFVGDLSETSDDRNRIQSL